jgi:hypothetical protein
VMPLQKCQLLLLLLQPLMSWVYEFVKHRCCLIAGSTLSCRCW